MQITQLLRAAAHGDAEAMEQALRVLYGDSVWFENADDLHALMHELETLLVDASTGTPEKL